MHICLDREVFVRLNIEVDPTIVSFTNPATGATFKVGDLVKGYRSGWYKILGFSPSTYREGALLVQLQMVYTGNGKARSQIECCDAAWLLHASTSVYNKIQENIEENKRLLAMLREFGYEQEELS